MTKEENLSFHAAFGDTIRSKSPQKEKLKLLWNFIAIVGKQHGIREALGTYGIVKTDICGLYVFEFCSMFDLAIGNTFRQKETYKLIWIHLKSKHDGHLIDFIITKKRDIGDVCNVRVLRSVECETNPKLVRGKFKLRIREKDSDERGESFLMHQK